MNHLIAFRCFWKSIGGVGYWHQLGSLARTAGVNFGVPHPSHKIFPARGFFSKIPRWHYLESLATKDKIWGTAGPTAALNTFLQMSPPGEFVATWIGNDWQVFHGFFQHIWRSELWHFLGSDVFIHMLSLSQTRTRFWELKAQADGISDDWSVFGAFYGPVKTCKYRDAIRIHYSVSPQTPTNRTSQNHRWNLT